MLFAQYRKLSLQNIGRMNGLGWMSMFLALVTMSCSQSFEESNAFEIVQDSSVAMVNVQYWQDQCESCHQTEKLADDGSIRYWGSRSLASLQQYVSSAMPYTNPGLCVGECATETARYLQAVLSGNTIVNTSTVDDGLDTPAPSDSNLDKNDIAVPESYASQCVSCHSVEKIQADFAGWKMQNTAELSTYIEATMPFANASACIGDCASENAVFILAMLDATSQPTDSTNPADPTDSVSSRVLEKPTGLVVQETNGDVTLRWTDNSSNESAFRIWRKLGSNSWAVYQNMAANVTEYVDKAVPTQIVQYRVEAINDKGDSAMSTSVVIDLAPTDEIKSCTAPAYKAGTPYSSGQSVQVNGRLYECKTSVSAWCSSTAAWAYEPEKGLYWTEAWTDIGVCDGSGSTSPVIVLNTPTFISATIRELSVTLSWLDNSDGETGYIVEKSVDGAAFVVVATLPSNTEAFVEQNNTPGSTVTFRIFATSDDANSNKLLTQALMIPENQFDAAAFYVSDCSACHGARGEGTSNSVVSIEGFQAKSWTLESMTDAIDKTMPYGNVDLCVGECASSLAIYILAEFVEATNKPASVSNLFVGANSEKTLINISWSDNSNNETGFRIEKSVGSGVFTLLKNVGQNMTTLTDTDVEMGQSYRYRISAFNDIEVSLPLTSSSFLLEVVVTLPQKPSNLQVNWVGDRASLSWTDNANNELNFVLQRRKNKGNWGGDIILAENQTAYSDTDIVIGNIYDYRLLATNSAGDSSWSDELTLDLSNAVNRVEFETHCATCHKSGGVAVDLFDGFTANPWQAKSWQQFTTKVNSMPTGNCDANCKLKAATYVWAEQWGYDLGGSNVTQSRGARGVRLLTSYEYLNTVNDVFGYQIPVERLPADRQASDFKYAADAHAGIVIYDRLNEFLLLAEYIAANAPASGYGCGATCTNTQLKTLLEFAFRQPVDNKMLNDYSVMQSTYGRDDMIASILLSPLFVYRIELGQWNTDVQAYQLTDHEVATALSYQLWGTTPSKALLAKANQGLLRTQEQIEAEAKVMVADVQAAKHLVEFVKYYTNTQADLAEKPNLSTSVISAMEQERNTAIEYTLQQGEGTLDELFNPKFTFVNNTLAAQYGIPGVTTTSMTKVPVDRTRGGLLLQGILQVHNSDFTATSLVKRGKMIRENMMCHAMGVPSGVDPSAIELPTQAISTRERWDIITGPDASEGQCWSCHQLMNEPGSVLESYDAAGRFRTQEVAYNNSNINVAIDTAGLLRSNDTTEVLVNYQDARELSEYLANSPVGQDCFVDNYVRFTTGYAVDDAVKADVSQWSQGFRVNGEIWPLVLQSVSSESFLYRTDRF